MAKANTVTILVGADNIARAILAIKKSGKKLDGDIHQAALSAAAHFLGDIATGGTNQGGDVFLINSLYSAMPKGARHVALTAWFLAFAGVQANTGESKAQTPFIKDANKQVDLVGGVEMPWYSMKPSKKPDEVVDLYALLLKVMEKASKDDAQLAHSELLEPLKEFMETHKPIEQEEVEPS